MRTLGSFNERVNLERHHDDHRPVAKDRLAVKTLQTDGYTLGIARNTTPQGRYGPTGGDFGQSRETPGRRRMAGQALGIRFIRGSGSATTVTPSIMGSAELRTPSVPQ
jgi:hypothetical protein